MTKKGEAHHMRLTFFQKKRLMGMCKLKILILTIILFLMLQNNLSAQERVGIFIMPAKIEIISKPGGNLRKKVLVKNKGAGRIKIKTAVKDYLVRPDGQFIFRPAYKNTNSCSSWLTVKPSSISLKPNQAREVDLLIKIPKKIEKGDHWAALIFEEDSKKNKKRQVRASVASLVFVTIPGKIRREINIDSLSFHKGWLSNNGQGKIEISNSGNVHMTIKGKMSFIKKQGNINSIKSLGPLTILPNSSRKIVIPFKNTPLLGFYRIKARIEYGPDLFTYNRAKEKNREIILYPLLFILTSILPLMISFTRIIFRFL